MLMSNFEIGEVDIREAVSLAENGRFIKLPWQGSLETC